ncbi:MAG: PD-(D/E)XK nuclease family protein [Gammaproteobacteria bacterium]
MPLSDHRLIITINRRLARELTDQYSKVQIKAGNQVWESPVVLPWSSWLNNLWRQELDEQIHSPKILLNNTQSQVVWENIIRYSSATDGLLQVSETTKVVIQAWHLLNEYQVPFDQIKQQLVESNLDMQAFAEWVKSYRDRLKYKGWIDQEMLASELIEQFDSGKQKIPKKILLAGFDQLTPLQLCIINLLTARGCVIETCKPENRRSQAFRYACTDSDQELKFAARRTRYLLEQNPATRIGIVIPNLQKDKAKVEAIFEDVLQPGNILSGTTHTRPFNLSLGDSLANFPMIKTAFLILTAATSRLPLEDLSRLIRSPYIGGSETEMAKRCLLDAQLRNYGDDSLGLSLVVKEASLDEAWKCPLLVEIIGKNKSLMEEKDLSEKRSIVDWINVFDELLKSIGWPGERTLNSDEYQLRESWEAVREQCAILETVTQEMGYRIALQHFRKMVSDQIFQAETVDVPVQIMGMLETAGLQFDHLWVMGMTDDQWPAKPTPNPFLPTSLQRKHNMAHATADWELNFARSVTDKLLVSAPEVIFSYSLNEADQELRPSPLIKNLPEKAELTSEMSQLPDYCQQMRSQSVLEKLVDNRASSLSEQQNWKGGVGIFKDQAACPFRAFVRHRLRAEPLGVAESGLNPAERGSLVHAALENLWNNLQTQEKLNQLSDELIKKEIRHSVEMALEQLHSGKSVIKTEQFQSLELARLETLLTEWLQVERSRDPFNVIASEEELELTVGGISVKTRVDRIDQLETGELVLIDYKTGEVNTNSWLGDRPDEPQLPLYATNMPEPPDAVLFAKLKKGDQKFVGFSADLSLGKTQEDWDQLISEWKKTLENIAKQFRHGEAKVDPKEATTCQYCNYQSLCRIDEVVDQKGSES